MPAISVIIPVYNVEKYLGECLDSIINQTLKDIEIICINDGSTDNSLKILKEYAQKDNRIIIIDQDNKGIGVTRNKGLDAAKGEYIAFVDSDDFIELNTFEIIYKKIIETKAEIVIFDFAVCNEKNEFIKNVILSERLKKESNITIKNNDIISGDVLFQRLSMNLLVWNKIFSANFIKTNNLRFANSRIGEDNIFSIFAYIYAKRILYLNNSFYHYRQRTNSLVHTISCESFGVFENISQIKEKLLLHNLYKKYMKSFEQYIIEALYWDYLRTPKKSKKFYLQQCSQILKPTDYKSLMKIINEEGNFLQKIFSVRNTIDKLYKIITIFGLKIKIRRNNIGK